MRYGDDPPAANLAVLKVVILLLLFGVVVSLASGLLFLFKDSDRQDSRRTLYALGIRITLAAALILTVFYGLYTGQLRMGMNAPWHERPREGASEDAPAPMPETAPREDRAPAPGRPDQST